eukprot:Hpha_TRINITY_DN16515_c1_g4::TRINITY_DN16515_c1_g4_i2::g.133849::m.133849
MALVSSPVKAQAPRETDSAEALVSTMKSMTLSDATDATEPMTTSAGRAAAPEADAGHVQRAKPHVISVFNPADYTTAQLRCNLADLRLEELYLFAAGHFGVDPTGIDLLFNGVPLLLEPGLKTIDVGIGNGAVTVINFKTDNFFMPQVPQVPQMHPMMHGYGRQPQFMPTGMHMGGFGPSPPLTPMGNPGRVPGAGVFHDQRCAISGHGPEALSSLPSSCTGASSRGGSPHGMPMGDMSLATGDFCSYALSSDGSRSLIQALHTLGASAHETVSQLLTLIRPKFAMMACHQHASKVLSAIVAVASLPQVQELMVIAATMGLVEIADTSAGSDLLVSLVCSLPPVSPDGGPVAEVLIGALVANVVPLCTSVNGRKVLQAAVSHLNPVEVQPLYEAVCINMLTLATDQCACITLQRLYDSSADPALRAMLQAQILESMPHLITDPYGNYVLQHAVKDSPVCSQLVAKQLAGRVGDLASNKFASNVIERCIQSGPEDVREALVMEICDPSTIGCLVSDAFGNYVVQSAVDHAPQALVEVLKHAVAPLISKSPYGYRIDSKLQRRLKRSTRHNGKDNVNPRFDFGAMPLAQ